ncbi:MAG: cAMP-binding protein [Rhodospirillaceae bacterium]|nr:cAMP-binding protein [Rhodospirillaceae bacterium]|tara:strand:- start:1 stop:360 length:360 start_codon:yes stop_codon:yes gene_type:complete
MASQKATTVLDRKTVPSGTVVFREGETGSTAFIVESGKVEIWKGNESERHRLGVISEGGIFGEMALIDGEPRMASATTLTDCVLVSVSESMLQDKLDRSDPFVVALLRIFAHNIRTITK